MSHRLKHYVHGKKKRKWKIIEAKRVVKTTETQWYTPSEKEDHDKKLERYDYGE